MRAITADLPPKEQKSPKHFPFRKRFQHCAFSISKIDYTFFNFMSFHY